jgi:3-methyladenine DNA glycosylase/8-oxoguanine DNA glycosylase
MPAGRERALRALAEAVAGGLRLDPPLDVAATRAALLALPGVGPWTVEYVAMRALRDPDAWPGTDLWLARAAAGADPGRWRPYRAYAAMVLWQT